MSFDVSKKTIGQLFSGDNFYVLPAYQRPFSWTKKEAIKLLDDLFLAYAEQGTTPYFLGMSVSIQQTMDENPTDAALPTTISETATTSKTLYVNGIIDGQQRLATLTILLSVLRDMTKDEGEQTLIRNLIEVNNTSVHPFRLVLFTNDNDIFENYIQPDGATNNQSDNPDLHESQVNIIEIRDLYKARLGQLAPEHRSGLLKFIIEQTTIIFVTATDLDAGYKIFMSINASGKKLSLSDIARASFLGSVPADNRETVTREWRKYEEILGEDFDSIFSFIQRIHGRRSQQVIKENIAIAKDAGGSGPYINNIVTPLAKALIYLKTPEARNLPENHPIHRYITMLQWMKNDAWIPPVLQFLKTNHTNIDETGKFFREMHRLVFGMTVMGMGDSKRITRQRSLIRAVTDNTHWDKSTSPLFLNADEQKKILFQLTFNLYSSSSQSSKLILLLLNDMFAGGNINFDPTEISVEHVFPRRPAKRSNWLEIMADANQRDTCHASIGNQVPLTLKMNEQVKNWDYDVKKEVMFPKDPVTEIRKHTEFAMTNRLLTIKDWDYPAIMENEALYLDMLKKAIATRRPVW